MATAVDESEEVARLRAEVAMLRGASKQAASAPTANNSSAFFVASPDETQLEEKQATPEKSAKPSPSTSNSRV
jgi:hypothetical protein